MRHVRKIEELKVGNVVLLVGYDGMNFASGDADGWMSEIYSVAGLGSPELREDLTALGVVLAKAEGGALEKTTTLHAAYQEDRPTFYLGVDFSHNTSVEVSVFVLQEKRMADSGNEEEIVQEVSLA